MGGCLSLLYSYMKSADVNKDGVVDVKDLNIGVNKLMSAMNFDPAVAQNTFDTFCSKVEKIIDFLEAAEVLFASDPQTLEQVKLALSVLKAFTLLKTATIDVGSQAREATLNITDVGKTITDVQRTSASIQAYLSLFEKAGINVGLKANNFSQVDSALNRIKEMQALWSELNHSTMTADPIKATLTTI